MIAGLAIFFCIVVVYSVVAAWLNKRSITMPMFFVVVGALIGSQGLGLLDISLSSETIKLLVEITLALLLFADSSTLSLRQIREDPSLPSRLLGFALPLIIVFGGVAALGLFPDEGIGFAMLLGSILAPTDAALGMPIFTNRRVPARIRRALNIESGLNDGIATPFVTLFIAMAVAEQTQQVSNWLVIAVVEILIAIGVGVGVGLLGGWLFTKATKHRLTTRTTEQIGILMLALATYLVSIALGGNGFIAAFVGGMFFGASSHHRKHNAVEFTEVTGSLLSVFVWTVFGSLMVIPLITHFNFRALLYAILSLTLVRMLPVGISMISKGLRRDTLFIMGWLGPRGLASVVFTILAYESFTEASRPLDNLLAMAGWTILLSVLLHGFSARPLAAWYANRLKTADPSVPELVEVADLDVAHQAVRSYNSTSQE